jgi:phage internal scaffolding protein
MNDILFPEIVADSSAQDLMPPYNFYAGRNTASFALMFDTDEGKSRTSQEFAEDADINNIMARYVKTGTVPMYMDRNMLDGDMHVMSYHEMQNVIADANSAFASLPATVRARFENDPAKYIEFVSDENNLEEARELGMLSPEAVERLDKAEADRAAAEAGRAQGGGTPSGQAPQDPASTQ